MPILPKQAFVLDDIRGREPVFLLDIEIAGQTLHLATRSVTAPTGDDNADVEYIGALDFAEQVDDQMSMLSDTPDEKSVALALYLSDVGVNVSDLISNGAILGNGRGSLHMFFEGASNYVTVVTGLFKDPEWDTDDDPVTGSLVENPIDDERLWPLVTQKVDNEDTDPDPEYVGEYYPLVFGTPGIDDADFPSSTPAIPKSITSGNITKWIVSLGHVNATQAHMYNKSTGEYFYETVVNDLDDKKNPIAYVDTNDAIIGSQDPWSAQPTQGDEVWIDWRNITNNEQFGFKYKERPNGLYGAGDVLTYWLEQTGIRWDYDRVYAAVERMNGFKLSGYVMASPDQRISPFAWIQDNLLPILPISPRIGPNGLYFVWWEYEATELDAIAPIEYGLNADREGAVSLSGINDVYSEVALSYRPMYGSRYFSTLTITGDPETLAADATAVSTVHSRRSFDRYGRRPVLQLSSDYIYSNPTAQKVLNWRSVRHGTQYYECTYLVDDEIAASLSPGSPVTITDSGRGWSNRICLVSGIQWSAQKRWPVSIAIPVADMGLAV